MPEPVVATAATTTTTKGRLRGCVEGGLCVFRGVPFAAPPVGDLRFAPPAEVPGWDGVREATAFRQAASQNPSMLEQMMGGAATENGEDCLYLNVFTPGCDGGARPVMVWIHGGAFLTGTGSMAWYDGTRLAARDVVVVTLNYRLGAFGYLHLDGVVDGLPTAGNNGLLDQVAALEWVRDNIQHFGGDPGNVTVFGESAGAMSVGALLGVPAASGLFHRAILQSGACNFVAEPEGAADTARKFLAELGVDPSIGAVALRQVPAADLLAAQERVSSSHPIEKGLAFTPVVDGSVIPRQPLHAVVSGAAAGVDLLAGSNLEEMKMFLLLEPDLANMDEAGLRVRSDEIFVERGAQPGDGLATYRRRLPDAGTSEVLAAVLSDYTFRMPAITLLDAQRPHCPNVYSYLFAHHSPAFGGLMGASHALEIPFVWDNLRQPGAAMFAGDATEELQALAAAMADAWVSFARDGVPASDRLDQWPRYGERRSTMWLEPAACRLEDDPLADERKLWID